jgi:pSer/pThr/pTyr-binding forkhead associated (FHA) protein
MVAGNRTGVLVAQVELILEEGGKARKLALDLETISIGRTADNAVKISDALSSRHHCQLRKEGAGWVVEDLGSRNGTKLNGSPLTEATALTPGDRVEVGDSIIHFRERRKRNSTRRRRRTGGPAQAKDALQLRVLEGEAQGQAFELTPLPFTLGRKPSCNLTLEDGDVSGEHCMVVDDGGVLHLVDLGSTNGTFLDGVRIKGRAPLRVGVRLRLGATLTFSLEEAGAVAKRSARAKRSGQGRVSGQRSARKPKAAPKEVEEIDSLEALGEDDETAVASPPEQSPPPDASDAHAVVAQEGDVLAVEFGAGLEAGVERIGGGGGGGAALMAVTLLLVAGAVGAAAWTSLVATEVGDPSPVENKLENWSFEALGGGAIDGWELMADRADPVASDAGYGRRALALTVAPGTRPEVRTVGFSRIEGGGSYRARAMVRRDAGTAAALRLDWRSDDGSFEASTYVAVLPRASGASGWRDLSGSVLAPKAATQVRVAVVALASGSAGKVTLDRVSLSEGDPMPAPPEVAGPAGLSLVPGPRGVLRIQRKGTHLVQELVRGAGLALNPDDPLSSQAAATIDQPLGLQPDGSLLALGTVNAPERTVEYTFTARGGAEGSRVRWHVAGEQGLPLVFAVPDLKGLQPLELDGQPAPAQAPEGGKTWEGVREMAWGSGSQQVSFLLTGPAKVTLRPAPSGRGAQLLFAIQPRALANGLLEVGFDLQAASQQSREMVQRLVQDGDAARLAGRHKEAADAYRRLLRDFAHEEEASDQARRGLAALEARADQLVVEVRWARAKAEVMAVPALLDAARAAVGELEAGFEGSSQLREARRELQHVQRAVAEAERREASLRARELLERAKALRTQGHVRMARLLYRYMLDHFDADLPPVVEAKDRLAALPPEEAR